jgi:hypothetical protein
LAWPITEKPSSRKKEQRVVIFMVYFSIESLAQNAALERLAHAT